MRSLTDLPIASRGAKARIVAKGSTTHSLEGVLESVEPAEARLQLPERSISIPAAAIISIEIFDETSRSWNPARLPSPLAETMLPLGDVLRTGSGATVRNANEKTIHDAISVIDNVKSELVAKANIAACDSLLRKFHLLATCMQSQANYEEASWARQEFLEGSSADSRGLGEEEQTRPASGEATSEIVASQALGVSERLEHVFNAYWQNYENSVAPRPSIDSSGSVPRVTVDSNGEVDLPFKISLANTFAPARHVRLMPTITDSFAIVGAEPSLAVLQSGETARLTLRITVPQPKDEATILTIKAQLKFVTPSGQERMSSQQSVAFRLHPFRNFTTIPNPFAPYAGGTTVADPSMFFGRQALVAEVVTAMSHGPIGQCYALYGQKRSGKSSLLRQVAAKLDRPTICVSVSLGTLDRKELMASFANEILQQIRVSVLSEVGNSEGKALDKLWPEESRIYERPLESLRGALAGARQVLARYPGWAGLRYVLLLDEFTYLFEVLRRAHSEPKELVDVREFMRQWKALIDSQAFSAVVVGQDTMPHAMRKFANEFSNMTTKRLSYLSMDETRELADVPILRSDKTSRYVGYGLAAIHNYTDGHPFFTQIMADKIVRLANQRKQSDITEGLVEEALESLVEGPDAMDIYRFDCFLSADNTGLPAARVGDSYSDLDQFIDDGGERALLLLQRLAQLSGPQGRWVSSEQLDARPQEQETLEDLRVREVIVEKNGTYRIRVLLFAEYLRRM